MVFITTTTAICGHATLGKPKRSRQTVRDRSLFMAGGGTEEKMVG